MGETPDEIRADIESTRSGLSQTATVLADKVSPSKIARRRVEAVKGMAGSARDTVMGSAQSLADTGSATTAQVADTLGQAPVRAQQAARGNPLAAGMIAFGAGLLAATLIPTSDPEARAGGQIKESLVDPLRRTAQDSAQEITSDLSEQTQQAMESVTGAAREALNTTAEEARRAGTDVTDTAQQGLSTVRERAGN